MTLSNSEREGVKKIKKEKTFCILLHLDFEVILYGNKSESISFFHTSTFKTIFQLFKQKMKKKGMNIMNGLLFFYSAH